jgi:hypothetical protein
MIKNSPWGAVQGCREIADGITFVSTASHGGIKLSQARLQQLPMILQFEAGWYEEDCESSFVIFGFPQYFSENQVQSAKRIMMDYFPTQYESVTGEVIPFSKSLKKRELDFKAKTKDRFVSISAYSIDNGMVKICATLGGSREYGAVEKCFVLPSSLYATRNYFGFIVDTENPEIQEVKGWNDLTPV